MKRRTAILSVLIASALAVGSLIVTSALARGSGKSQWHFDRMSNVGTQVAGVASKDVSTLVSGGATGALNRLGHKNQWVFYTSPGKSQGTCFGVGPESTGHIAILACPSPGASPNADEFPSDSVPVFDMSPIAGHPWIRNAQKFLDLVGVAADGIAKVGVIDQSGTLYTTPVVDNYYSGDPPDAWASALVAFDADGVEVYRRTYTNPDS